MNVTSQVIKVRILFHSVISWPVCIQPGFSSFGEKYFSFEIYIDFSLID